MYKDKCELEDYTIDELREMSIEELDKIVSERANIVELDEELNK